MASSNISVRRDQPRAAVQRTQSSSEASEPSRFMRALFGWDPFRELSAPLAPFYGGEMERELSPAFDVKDTPEAFVFHADVPGMKEEDVQVQLRGTRLTISGKREAQKEKQHETYYTYERSYGTFARTFTLPESADVDNVTADMKDGVLTVNVPKRASEKARSVAITSGAGPTNGNVAKS